VIDTATLISAIRSNGGAAAEVVRLAVLQRLTLLMDYKLACEYRDVALRSEHLSASGKASEDVEAIIEALEVIAIPVLVTVRHRPLSRDENDDMVLDIAINGVADFVVTNNVRDFRSPARRFGIGVLTAGQLLTEIRKGEIDNAGE
jgi:putative PIN family toxin of toxin-antitoxin system